LTRVGLVPDSLILTNIIAVQCTRKTLHILKGVLGVSHFLKAPVSLHAAHRHSNLVCAKKLHATPVHHLCKPRVWMHCTGYTMIATAIISPKRLMRSGLLGYFLSLSKQFAMFACRALHLFPCVCQLRGGQPGQRMAQKICWASLTTPSPLLSVRSSVQFILVPAFSANLKQLKLSHILMS